MQRFMHWFAAALAAVSLDVVAGDYTDLWWNPQESGWGVNIVHQGDTAFVTLYVYGQDGKPAWYFASDARLFAEDASGRPALRGTLYKATGPWQGGPFDPKNVAVQVAGTLVLEPRGADRLLVAYTVDGVAVEKEVKRLTFALPYYATNYHASFNLRQSIPDGVPYGTRQYPADVLFLLDEGQMFMRVDEQHSRCDYRGTYQAEGKFGKVSGQFTCAGGAGGTFTITELEIAKHGVSGYLRTFGAENNQAGRFAGARY